MMFWFKIFLVILSYNFISGKKIRIRSKYYHELRYLDGSFVKDNSYLSELSLDDLDVDLSKAIRCSMRCFTNITNGCTTSCFNKTDDTCYHLQGAVIFPPENNPDPLKGDLPCYTTHVNNFFKGKTLTITIRNLAVLGPETQPMDDIFLGKDTLTYLYHGAHCWYSVDLGPTFRAPARIRIYEVFEMQGSNLNFYLTNVIPPTNTNAPSVNIAHRLPTPSVSNEGSMKFYEFLIDTSVAADRTVLIIYNAQTVWNYVGQFVIDLL